MKLLIVLASGVLAAGLLPTTQIRSEQSMYGYICFAVMVATGFALSWHDKEFRYMFGVILEAIIIVVLLYGIALLQGWVKP